MNNAECIQQIAKQTGENEETCSLVVKGYETYCEKELKRPFSQTIDSEMLQWISTETSVGTQTVQEIVNTLIRLVRNTIKTKFFWK